MGEKWGASTCTYDEPVPGLYCIRITSVTNGDTVTLPVKRVVACSGVDETSAGVLKIARGSGTSANQLTITCTSSDTVNIIAFCIK
jgi:hypothetical protein